MTYDRLKVTFFFFQFISDWWEQSELTNSLFSSDVICVSLTTLDFLNSITRRLQQQQPRLRMQGIKEPSKDFDMLRGLLHFNTKLIQLINHCTYETNPIFELNRKWFSTHMILSSLESNISHEGCAFNISFYSSDFANFWCTFNI